MRCIQKISKRESGQAEQLQPVFPVQADDVIDAEYLIAQTRKKEERHATEGSINRSKTKPGNTLPPFL
jgi:hypothetical protein